jgi:hypothetical protein
LCNLEVIHQTPAENISCDDFRCSNVWSADDIPENLTFKTVYQLGYSVSQISAIIVALTYPAKYIIAQFSGLWAWRDAARFHLEAFTRVIQL